MRKVCVITGTRADYGLLSPVMRLVLSDERLELQVIATCMHLSPQFGETVRLIEADGFRVDERVEMLLSSDTEAGTAISTGLGTIGLTRALERLKPDVVVLLGDRFETLAAATSAFLLRIPIAHIHGGELTLGAMDDGMRHAITKLSLLHFTAAEDYRRRVIQLGEDPSRVLTVGALGVDNALSVEFLPREALEADLGVTLRPPVLVVTFHPVTLEGGTGSQMQALLEALDRFPQATVVFTMPNADPGNREISERISAWASSHPDTSAYAVALGHVRYLSLLRVSDAVVGNSSSGILEAPALGVPVVDIGNRQTGRIRPEAVIHVEPDSASIARAIGQALEPAFHDKARNAPNPYGDGHAAERIVEALATADLSSEALLKRFHDIEAEGERP